MRDHTDRAAVLRVVQVRTARVQELVETSNDFRVPRSNVVLFADISFETGLIAR